VITSEGLKKNLVLHRRDALLPAEAAIAIVNRGICGNRIRLDAPPSTPSWGRSGLQDR
jgi:hypothetical protein